MNRVLFLIPILLLAVGCSQSQLPVATSQPEHTATVPEIPSTLIPPAATPTPPISPRSDGNSVIAFTSEQDGNMDIYVMSAGGGTPQQLTNHPKDDYWPTWSPDGTQIAFASERDGDFEIYTIDANGSSLRRLTHATGNDLEPAWSPDGTQIAFMVHQANKSDIYVMNDDGRERQPLTASEGDNYLPKWSPDGAQIVFVSERDGNPEIYAMNADGSGQRRLTDNPAADLYPAWSPDGTRISFYSERDGGRELYIMDVDGRNLHSLTQDNAYVWVSDWSPDGSQITFTSDRDGNREIYVMGADGRNLRRLTNNNVLDGIPAWRPEEAAFATTEAEPIPPTIMQGGAPISPENAATVIQLWQADMLSFLELHETCGVAFSPDGIYLAAACRSPTIPMWDVATGQLVRTFGGGGYVWTNVAFSPDGETLASSGHERAISLWDVETGERQRKISDAPGYMSEIIYSPDGQLLAAGSFSGSASLWDVTTNDTLFEFFGHDSRVNCINFSPDGRLLVTGGGDNKARVWEASTGEETLVLSGATHFIEDVEFSPSGQQIVGASDNSRIYVWDAASGDLLNTLRGHSGPVNGVTYSSDGRLLASTSNDRTLRLWDANSGEDLSQLTGHTDLAIRSAFNPNGSLIASVAWDGTVRLWGLSESDENRADGLSETEAATLNSLEQVDDYPLYTMHYYGNYNQHEVGVVGRPSWACSLFAALGDEENMVYGRNFDWRYSPALLLFTDPPDGYASVSMVDIEYLVGAENAGRLINLPLAEQVALLDAPFWPFDGMNENGLVIGMAAVPQGNVPPDPDKETVGSLLAMRRVLDQARDVDEAVAILQSFNIEWGGGPDLHYLVADRSGRSLLVEFHQGKIVLIPNPADEPWHLATNFLLASVGESAAGACWRYDRISERLLDVNGSMTTAGALDLLTQVAQDNTQWSIVYGLSTGDVIVTMGQDHENQHNFHLGLADEQ